MPKYFTASDLRVYEPRFTEGLDDSVLEEALDVAEAWAERAFEERGVDAPIPSDCQSALFKRAVLKMAASFLVSDYYIGDLDPKVAEVMVREAEKLIDQAISACLSATGEEVSESSGPGYGVDEVDWEEEAWP